MPRKALDPYPTKNPMKIERFKRTVDPAGTDKGQAREIEELARRKTVLGGLEPTVPKFGNPAKQIPSAVRKVGGIIKKALDYNPYEKKRKK